MAASKNIDSRVEKVLISELEINSGIKKAAKWINQNYKDKNLVIISILKGSIPFVGNLLPKITVDHKIDFMSISSFKGNITAVTDPELISDITINIEGKDVLLIEDIIDTARTISKVIECLKNRNPSSLKVLTLLDKPDGRVTELVPDYICFTIPLLFIVGFGLDYDEQMRNLPYIGILKEDIYLNRNKKG